MDLHEGAQRTKEGRGGSDCPEGTGWFGGHYRTSGLCH